VLQYTYFESSPSLSAQSDPHCFAHGQCITSLVLDTVEASDAIQCLKKCQEYEGCQYFNFYYDSNPVLPSNRRSCELLANCIEISEEICDSCNTGKKSCSGK